MSIRNNSRMTIFIAFVISLSFFSLADAEFEVAGRVWKQVALRTEAMKAAGLEGGEGMQHIYSMSYAPSDSSIVYLVNNTAQVWKSENGGDSWKLMNKGFFANGGISLAVDPDNPNRVFVAGARFRNDMSSMVDGIYRTVDGGENWQLVRQSNYYNLSMKDENGNYETYSESGGDYFAFADPSTVYAGTHEDGLLKSTEGGETGSWITLLSSDDLDNEKILDIKVHPNNSSIIYLATEGGLYLVEDGETVNFEKLGDSLVGQDTMLINPGFETGDFSGWSTSYNSYAVFSIDTNTHAANNIYSAKAEVTGGGSSRWTVRLFQDITGYVLEKGEDYTVTFWAKGNGFSGSDEVSVILNDPSYGWLTSERKLTVSSDWQQYELDFHNLLADGGNARLNFLLGDLQGVTFWVDDVVFSHVDMLDNGLPADPEDFPRSMAINPDQPGIMYVSVGKSGVYKTEDGGLSFHPVNEGLNGAGNPLRYDKNADHLAMSPADPLRLYIGFYKWWGIAPYFSDNGGETWHPASTLDENDLFLEFHESSFDETGKLNGYVTKTSYPYLSSAIAPHPHLGIEGEDKTVLVSTGACHPVKSTDGGDIYMYSSTGYTGSGASWGSAAFGFDPYDPEKIVFFLGDYGPMISENGGSTFRSLQPAGYGDMTPGAVDLREGDQVIISPARPNGGDQILAVARRQNGNEEWTWKMFNGTYDSSEDKFHFVAFNPDDPQGNVIYAGSWKSTDRGGSWSPVTNNGEPVSIRAMFPGNGDIVYAIKSSAYFSNSIIKSTDRGETWTDPYAVIGEYVDDVFQGESINNIYQSEIAIDPVDPDRVYVAARDALYIWNGQEWIVRDERHGLEKDELGQLSVARITVDPNDRNVIYIGKWAWGYRSNGIFRSTDRGEYFEQIHSEISPEWGALAVSPHNSVLYLGSPYGTHVLCTDNDGDGYATEGEMCGYIDVDDSDPSMYRIDDLSAKDQNQKIKLQWTCAPGTGTYNIYRGTTQGGPYEQIAVGHQTDECNYFDYEPVSGQTYYYVVRWADVSGHETADSNEAAATQ